MCGRYNNLIAKDAYARVFKPARMPESNFPPRYNIAPTQQIPILRIAKDGARELTMVRWGLVPFFSKTIPKQLMINARAETVRKLPSFRDAFAQRRALIPASGFYEWQQREDGKQPYLFRPKDGEPMAFAGLWEFCRLGEKDILSATIIVGAPNPLVSPVHDRMPVILNPADYDRWLDPYASGEDLATLLKPCPETWLEAFAVNRAVNNVRNDDERCMEPVST